MNTNQSVTELFNRLSLTEQNSSPTSTRAPIDTAASTMPTISLASLQAANCIDSSGKCLGQTSLYLTQESNVLLNNFLHAPRIIGQTQVSLDYILKTILNSLQNSLKDNTIELLGEELFKLLGKELLTQGLRALTTTQYCLPTEIEAECNQIPQAVTFRIHLAENISITDRQVLITTLRTHLAPFHQTALSNCFHSDSEYHNFSGFTLDTVYNAHPQKINFIFATKLFPPFFATSDAVHLLISPSAGHIQLIDYGMNGQWLIDTVFKRLTIAYPEHVNNPTKMLLRHIQSGFLPLDSAYKSFSRETKSAEALLNESTRQVTGSPLQTLYIIYHLLSKRKRNHEELQTIDPSNHYCKEPSAFQAHFQLLATNKITFTQIEALTTLVTLCTGGLKGVTLQKRYHTLELVTEGIRFATDIRSAAEVFATIDPTLFLTEQFATWLTHFIEKSNCQSERLFDATVDDLPVTTITSCLTNLLTNQKNKRTAILHFLIAHQESFSFPLKTLCTVALQRMFSELSPSLPSLDACFEANFITLCLPSPEHQELGTLLLAKTANRALLEKWLPHLLKRPQAARCIAQLLKDAPQEQKQKLVTACVSHDYNAAFYMSKTLSKVDQELFLVELASSEQCVHLGYDFIQCMSHIVTEPVKFCSKHLLLSCANTIDHIDTAEWKSSFLAVANSIDINALKSVSTGALTLLFNPQVCRLAPALCFSYIDLLCHSVSSQEMTPDEKKLVRKNLDAIACQTENPLVVVAAIKLHQKECKDALSSTNKTHLITALYNDLTNGSHIPVAYIHWYLSLVEQQQLTKSTDAKQQLHTFLQLFYRHPQLLSKSHATYIQAISQRLQSCPTELQNEIQTCAEYLQVHNKPLRTLLDPLLAKQVAERTKQTSSATKTRKERAKELIDLPEPRDAEAKREAEKVAKVLIKEKSHVIFSLMLSYRITNPAIWKALYTAFDQSTDSTALCQLVNTLIQLKSYIDTQTQNEVWKHLLEQSSWMHNKKAICILNDIPLLIARAEAVLSKEKLSLQLKHTVEAMLQHVSESPNYFEKLIVLYNKIVLPQSHKSELSWKLFCQMPPNSTKALLESCSSLLTPMLEHLSQKLSVAFAPELHLQLNTSRKKSATTVVKPNDVLGPITRFFAQCIQHNACRDHLIFLMGFLQASAILTVHQTLLESLHSHPDVKIRSHLGQSIPRVLKHPSALTPGMEAVIAKILNHATPDIIAVVLSHYFVLPGKEPSTTLKSEQPKCIEKPDDLSRFQNNAICKQLPHLYPKFLISVIYDKALYKHALDIDISLRLHHPSLVDVMSQDIENYNYIQASLFCAHITHFGWNSTSQHFLSYITQLRLQAKGISAENSTDNEAICEINSLPLAGRRHYQVALANALANYPDIKPHIDEHVFTVIPRIVKEHSTMSTLERNYIDLVKDICTDTFTNWSNNPLSTRVRLFDFATTLLKITIDQYPKEITTELLTCFVRSCGQKDILFPFHKKIAIGILRQAIINSATTLTECKTNKWLEYLQITEATFETPPTESLDAITKIDITTPLSVEKIITLQEVIADWQEFDFQGNFDAREQALTILFQLWSKNFHDTLDPRLTVSFQSLLFPNELGFQLRSDAGRSHALKVTTLVKNCIVKLYIEALKKHDKSLSKINNILIPMPVVNGLNLLNIYITYLLKSEYVGVFTKDTTFYKNTVREIFTLIQEHHKEHLEHLDHMVSEITRLFAAGPHDDTALPEKITLIDQWLTFIKDNARTNKKALLCYALDALQTSNALTLKPDWATLLGR